MTTQTHIDKMLKVLRCQEIHNFVHMEHHPPSARRAKDYADGIESWAREVLSVTPTLSVAEAWEAAKEILTVKAFERAESKIAKIQSTNRGSV